MFQDIRKQFFEFSVARAKFQNYGKVFINVFNKQKVLS